MRKKIMIFLFLAVFSCIIKVDAKNIVKAYTYNEKDDNIKCITGNEETCQETKCYENTTKNSCLPGTIIDYKVNDKETVRFHVVSDDGDTMTLQQRENTISKITWYADSSDNSKGPLTVLEELEKATSTWTYVNNQTYTLGETIFNTNHYTGCDNYNSCTKITYKLPTKTAKVRLITIQETGSLGCTTSEKSCPIWMYNYLSSSTSFGGTEISYSSSAYWTMTANSSTTDEVWWVYCDGREYSTNADNPYSAARAVVVVNKEPITVTNKSSESNDENQTVKIEDTLKTTYLVYCIGTIILVLGIIVLVQTLRKKEMTNHK